MLNNLGFVLRCTRNQKRKTSSDNGAIEIYCQQHNNLRLTQANSIPLSLKDGAILMFKKVEFKAITVKQSYQLVPEVRLSI